MVRNTRVLLKDFTYSFPNEYPKIYSAHKYVKPISIIILTTDPKSMIIFIIKLKKPFHISIIIVLGI